MATKKFTKEESIFVSLLSLTLGVRQFATALITIFVSIYAQKLHYGSIEIGAIALGVYGLLQALLQIPFGVLSDKLDKKTVLLFGLGLLSLGLILSVVSNNAYVFVLARALQGAGAFASVGFSWLSIGVSKDKISNAINIAGLSIAIASTIGLSGSTLLMMFMSYKEMTYIDIICVLITFFLLLFFLKKPKNDTTIEKKVKLDSVFWQYFKKLLKTKEFTLVNFLSFVGTYTIVAIFFIVPQYLDSMHSANKLYLIFVPATVISTFLVRASLKFIKNGKTGLILVLSLLFMFLGTVLFIWNFSIIPLIIGTILFMIGYNIVVTLVPTITNLVVDKNEFRGTLNGVTNTFVYCGSFLGAIVTGDIWGYISPSIALFSIIILTLLGVLIGLYLLKTSVKLRELR